MGSKNMDMYRDRKNKGWCVQCGVELKDITKTYCKRCNNEINDLNKIRYNSRKASGQCVRCGEHLEDKDRLLNGKMPTSCLNCRRQKNKLRYERGWK